MSLNYDVNYPSFMKVPYDVTYSAAMMSLTCHVRNPATMTSQTPLLWRQKRYYVVTNPTV